MTPSLGRMADTQNNLPQERDHFPLIKCKTSSTPTKSEDRTPTGSDPQPWQKGDFTNNTDDKWKIITG